MYSPHFGGASLAARMVKNLPANAGDSGLIPNLEDSLEKEMVTHSNILAWEIPWTVELGGYSPWGHKRVGLNLPSKQQHFRYYVVIHK